MKDLKIAYVSADLGDAAVTRRVLGLIKAGAHVACFALVRSQNDYKTAKDIPVLHSLGETQHGHIFKRIFQLIKAVQLLFKKANDFDVLICRNLDMALIGLLALTGRTAHKVFVYEVLDIHPLASGSGILSVVVRMFERWVLSKTTLLIVSSERFYSDYFRRRQGYNGPFYLMENKLLLQQNQIKKPVQIAPMPPLVIGVFGKHRCPKSFQILIALAQRFPHKIEVHLAGTFNDTVVDVGARLCELPNVIDFGPYSYPSGLEDIYSRIHIGWGLDLSGGYNAHLLLPNRIYESGAFGVPLLAEKGTATGDYVVKYDLGFVVGGNLFDTIADLIDRLTNDDITSLQAKISKYPISYFISTDEYEQLCATLSTYVPRRD